MEAGKGLTRDLGDTATTAEVGKAIAGSARAIRSRGEAGRSARKVRADRRKGGEAPS